MINRWNLKSEKESKKIDIPAEITIKNELYTLHGIISHFGDRSTSGHYVTSIRSQDKWVCFEKNEMKLNSEIDFENSYLLFYVKQ